MNVARVESLAGVALIVGGLALAVASVISVGVAQSWNVADAFAAESIRPLRRIGMLLGVLGLAIVVAATPILVARAAGTPGFLWVTVGWIGFAFGGHPLRDGAWLGRDSDASPGRVGPSGRGFSTASR